MRQSVRATFALVAFGCLATVAATGCANRANTSSTETRTLNVAAAASLTAAFQELASVFEKAHQGTKVQVNFASSATLVTQISNGAPADVFASADEANMKKIADAGLLDGTAQVFARNRLAIVVSAGNPRKVTGLSDLARPGLVVSICAPQVPAGQYARQAFAKAGVAVPPGSQELDVKQVVSRVSLGQADAGVVYTTDVKAGGTKITGVDIPEGQNVIATYPAGALKKGANLAAGRAFVTFLTSTQSQTVLARYGFLAP